MRSLSLVAAFTAFWIHPAVPPTANSASAPDAAPAEREPHPAPQFHTENRPPEAQLSPPPNAEKIQLPPGLVGIENPAFPPRELAAPAVPQGRRYEASDLAPYFAAGRVAQAKAEFDRGHFLRARLLLESEGDSLPVRYLRALSGFRAEQHARAAEEMSALAKDYLALRDRCLTHAGIAYEELRSWDAAAERFGAVASNSKLFGDARLGLTRSLRHKGDLAGAVAAIAPLTAVPAPSFGRDLGAEALIVLADLHRERKNAEAERGALVKLWSAHPVSPLSAQAEKRLKGAKLSTEAQVTRGEVLIEAHRNERGVKLLQPLLTKLRLPDPLACRAHFAYGKALRKERQHADAIRALSPVVERCTDPDLLARALYVLGSSRAIADVPKGAETYEALGREFPNHSFADDALFFAADLHLKAGDFDRALQLLRQVAERYPKGDFAAEALFRSFWIHRSRKALQDGLKVLDQIEKAFGKAEESYEVERARYWRARLFEDLGRSSEAAEILETLVLEHPTTFYGLLARTRLAQIDRDRANRISRRMVVPSPPASPWPLFAGSLTDDPHFLSAIELLRLGFPEAVSAELLAVNRLQQSHESLRLMVQVLSAAGDLRSAHALARVTLRKELSGPINPQNLPVWEVAYPNAFRDLIERHCKPANVDPDLFQALIREESALDPKALSWAGALGLSQLMLPTARSIARPLKISKVTQESLLEPDQNIRLGAWYLGLLLRRFHGNKAHAIAAYNAGAEPVNHWRAARPKIELDEWIEEIPYADTRGYVKRVLRSYNTYKLLYARAAPVQTVSWSGP